MKLGEISVRDWLRFMHPGDWFTVGIAALAVVLSYPLLWQGGAAGKAQVRRDGVLVAELPLDIAKRISVDGPIGATVIEIQPGRARVVSDPGPRQYCVRQGWLTQSGAIAICAPNHVSLALSGRAAGHDSISY